jgi:hypothetical protein
MEWIVEGADKASGEDRVISVDALSKVQAERVAAQQGLLISDIRPPAVPTPAEKLAMVPPGSGDSQILSTTTLAGAVNYQSPLTPALAAPEYAGLKIGSTILIIGAVLYYILAALILVGSIVSALQTSIAPIQIMQTGTGIVAALTAFMFGGLLHAASAACVALRDIARNSYVK